MQTAKKSVSANVNGISVLMLINLEPAIVEARQNALKYQVKENESGAIYVPNQEEALIPDIH